MTTIALACPELKIGAAGFCMQHAEADLKATSMSAALIDRSMYVMYVYIYIYIYIDRSVYVIEREIAIVTIQYVINIEFLNILSDCIYAICVSPLPRHCASKPFRSCKRLCGMKAVVSLNSLDYAKYQ